MVPGQILPFVKAPTGLVRLRLEKAWFGTRTIVEREYSIEHRSTDSHPDSPPVMVSREWVRVSRWNFLGRNFLAEVA